MHEDRSRRSLPKRLIPIAAALSILSLAAIVAYASRNEDVLGTVSSLPWWALPAALGFHVCAHLMWGARVAVISNAMNIPMSPLRGWGLVTAGTFGGAITPGRVGGEVVKVGLLMKRGESAARASKVLLSDRFFDIVFFIVLGTFAVIVLPPLFGADALVARTLAGLGTLFLVVFFLLLIALLVRPTATARALGPIVRWMARLGRRDPDSWSIRFLEYVQEVRHGVHEMATKRPAAFGAAVVLTLLNWVIEYAAIWALLAAFGHTLPYWVVFAAGGVITLVSNIPLTPGGTGVAEGAGLALLLPLAPGLSPLMVVSWRIVTYNYDLLAGGAMAAWGFGRRGQTQAK